MLNCGVTLPVFGCGKGGAVFNRDRTEDLHVQPHLDHCQNQHIPQQQGRAEITLLWAGFRDCGFHGFLDYVRRLGCFKATIILALVALVLKLGFVLG
jgi:hypothetical protein